MENTSGLWLLKCGGRILGPHSTAELESLILKQDVMALDEVAAPFGRWGYLRDVEHFAPIFVALKNKDEFFSDNTTNSTDVNSTDTVSTVLPLDMVGFRNSDNMVQGIKAQLSSKALEEMTITDPGVSKQETPIQPAANEKSKEKSGVVEPTKIFGAAIDPEIRRRVRRRSSQRLLWLLGLVSIGAIIGSQVQSRRTPNEVAKPRTFEEVYAVALHAKKRGDYDRAKETFNNALLIRPKDEDAILQVVPILIERDEVVTAKRYLEDIRLSTKTENRQIG